MQQAVVFFGAYGKCVAALVGIAADGQVVPVFFLGGKSIVDILESEIGRIGFIPEIIGLSHEHIHIIHPCIAKVVEQNAGIGLIDNGVQLGSFAGGGVEAIVVKGEELGVIVAVLFFYA